MFHIVEVHSVVHVHVSIYIRKSDLDRHKKFKPAGNFFWMILLVHYNSISDLLVFSSILRMEGVKFTMSGTDSKETQAKSLLSALMVKGSSISASIKNLTS